MAEEFKNAHEHEIPKVATEEPTATTGEVKDRGMFNFLGKKDEVKPHETTTLESEFKKEDKPSLLEKLHQKHEDEEENKPSLLHKLHRSNSSSSSSEEEGEDGEKRKKEKKKIVGGDEKTEGEKKGIVEKMKEKLQGHGTKPEDDATVVTPVPVSAPPATVHTVEHPAEKKGIMEKIKEKLPGHHAKGSEEEEKKIKETY